ncbi:Homeobox-leucine zipper protein ROC1 [Zea mays]|uniref:Homeobox-leucine zipper protein ROC1 n=1 Tax=Zea mays TaxID=4577 RepID=A0A3L6G9T1_MAIZE|nr:Homeobox-leucine zipper protein ROC1 [Zea mays]
MTPARRMPAMIGRNNGVAFGSSSALSLSQVIIPADFLDSHHLQQAFEQQLFEQIPAAAVDSSDNIIHGRSDALVDEFESKSCSENPDGTASGDDGQGDEDPNQRPNKKKRYHRHTQHQIEEMEAFFKECPHPDDKQRKELSRELGLEPLQNQHERQENAQLRAENDKLRAENMRYKDALGTASCPSCGGPAALGEMSFDEHHLRLENARLRDEIDRISGIAAKHVGKPMVSFPVLSSPLAARSPFDLAGAYGVQPPGGGGGLGAADHLFGGAAGDLLRSVSAGQLSADKSMIVELAVAAMDELLRMARVDAPLWGGGVAGVPQQLDEEEYGRTFPGGLGPRQYGLRPEASRDDAVVIMTRDNLVEILMDANRFAAVFSSIVSRASTHEVLSTGVAGSYNGALQVMSMEFQVPSPLVPTRESYFVRYCKNNPDGTWAVVDVTWVEHVEVDDRSVHNLYRPLVNSGLGFGATRWVGTLDRQCERLASAMASNIPNGDLGVITSIEGRKSMLKLAERMVASFCGGVTASAAHQWTTLSGSGAEDVRVMTRKSVDDPGRPPGIVLNAATSFWLPVPPKRVFDFLRDETSRSEVRTGTSSPTVAQSKKWLILQTAGTMATASPFFVSMQSANSNQSNMLILQESCTDASGSYVVYAPVDVVAMNVVLNGGDPDYVALLPSGFAILPDGPPAPGMAPHHGGEGAAGGGLEELEAAGGSLLTVAFQILVDSVPTAKLSLGSVATVNSLIACTVERIKAAVCGAEGNPQ